MRLIKPSKISKTITLDQDVVRKIELLAHYGSLSFSRYINIVLVFHTLTLAAGELREIENNLTNKSNKS